MEKNNKSASLLFIFITILLDVIGIGLIIPVLPQLIKDFSGGDDGLAAQYSGWMMGVYGLMQFIFAPIIGALSDKYGRRPVLLFSLFGFALDYVLLAVAPSLGWLFIGRVIAGITGASFTTATAYIADISTPENRGKNFGLVGAAFGIGFIIGPLVGGLLLSYGIRIPFWFAAGLTFFNWMYGFFVLPESLSKENRRAFDWKRANPIGALVQLGKHKTIITLVFALICINLAGQVHPSTWSFFTMKMFHWDGKQVAYSLAFVGFIIALVQGGLIRYTTPRLGQKKSIIIGLIFFIVGLMLFSVASQPWMMYAFMVPFGLSGIAGPNLQGIISSQVSPTEQGELQGALTILMSLTAFVGPILHTNLFKFFASENSIVYFPGAAFLAGSILAFISLLIILKALPKIKGIS